MKIAVVISGEFRTFATCRKNFPGLDDKSVDVYFSTWSTTSTKNTRLNLDVSQEVSTQLIHDLIDERVVCSIDSQEFFQEQKYNSKMIDRWIAGIDMILHSRQEYTHILFCRPDMFFETKPDISQISDAGFLWYERDRFLQDCCFSLSMENMIKLRAVLSVKNWVDSDVKDWHTYWTQLISQVSTSIDRIFTYNRAAFCRSLIQKVDTTFPEVYEAYEIWRDTQILDFIQTNNRHQPVEAWGEAVVRAAEQRLASGFYSRYRRVAVLVCGMMRGQFKEAYESWEPLRKLGATWFLSTFDKSAESLSTKLYEPDLSKILPLFDNVHVEPLDYNVVVKKGHENCDRHYKSLSHFKNELAQFGRIIVIRPDTHLQVNDFEKFTLDVLGSTSNISTMVFEDFIQDFMLILNGSFFANLHITDAHIKEVHVWNPHKAIPHQIALMGEDIKQSINFCVSLLRPNTRGVANLNHETVGLLLVEWDRLMDPTIS